MVGLSQDGCDANVGPPKYESYVLLLGHDVQQKVLLLKRNINRFFWKVMLLMLTFDSVFVETGDEINAKVILSSVKLSERNHYTRIVKECVIQMNILIRASLAEEVSLASWSVKPSHSSVA
jgi:hypothetical protein